MHGKPRCAVANRVAARRGGGALLLAIIAAAAAPAAGAWADGGGGKAGPTAVAAAKADRFGHRTLQMGMTGPDVRLLQSWLSDLHYRVPTTGTFGPMTAGQVRAFQRHTRLAADGVVGPATASALRAAHGGGHSGGDGGGHSGGDGGGDSGDSGDGDDGGQSGNDHGSGDSGQGDAGWVFPFRPGVASPPASWTPDQGQDIFARGSACGPRAELLAVADGTVVQIGLSGFGPQAPVLKLESGAYAGRYVYYGHALPALVSVGDHVKAGDPIAQVGCGRVGISSGPHLELGMSVAGGPPCCPGYGVTAPIVRQILVGVYR